MKTLVDHELKNNSGARIAIVEDEGLLRELLSLYCRTLGHHVVVEAATGQEAIAQIIEHQPDLVLLDLRLPDILGTEVLERVRAAKVHPRCLVLAGACTENTLHRVENAQVQGFVEKSSDLSALGEAIGTVLAGGSYLSPAYRRARQERSGRPYAVHKMLTGRELEILALVGQFLTDAEIGSRLNISARTVETHRHTVGDNSGSGVEWPWFVLRANRALPDLRRGVSG